MFATVARDDVDNMRFHVHNGGVERQRSPRSNQFSKKPDSHRHWFLLHASGKHAFASLNGLALSPFARKAGIGILIFHF
jgi:hypothetical protein